MAAKAFNNDPIPFSGGSGQLVYESRHLYWIDPNEDRISCRPDVCGGAAQIRGTRIPIWGLEEARRCGDTDDDILDVFPTITKADLAAAWQYVALHQDEIDRVIALNNE